YLSAVLPGRVVSYRETRSMRALPQPEPGKIYIFSNAQIEHLERADLFWNSSSFHEMEPDIVANYLRHVNGTVEWAYIAAQLSGQKIATRPGANGVLRQTTLDDYRTGLVDFDLIDHTPMLRVTGAAQKEDNLLFKRRSYQP